MTVTYHSGERIQGTSTDLAGIPAVSGGWKELGRTTWSSGNSFTVSNIADKRYLMVLNYTDSASNYNNIMRFNSDTSLNYAWRRSINGESPDGTTKINTNSIAMNGVAYDDFGFAVNYIANLSNKEKLTIGHACDAGGVGASNAPDRQEVAGKWIETDPIDEITVTTGSANYNLGQTVVLGYDPDDTHTDNFWEELASVEGDGTSTTISSGTIPAKKYLWVQAFTNASSQNTGFQFNNDTGNHYAIRRSTNGTTDITDDTIGYIEGSDTSKAFTNMFIINNSANEKLTIGHSIHNPTVGAGTVPTRNEVVGKWVPTTNQQITEIDYMQQTTSVNFPSGSILKVWGAD